MMYVAVDVFGKSKETADRYRWGHPNGVDGLVRNLGAYSMATGEPDEYGDLLVWETDSEYTAHNQVDRLASGWFAARAGESVEEVIDYFRKVLA
jgi:hypothetical protein